jgi:hypothetical protein
MWCGCALVVPFLFQPTTSLHGIIGGLCGVGVHLLFRSFFNPPLACMASSED